MNTPLWPPIGAELRRMLREPAVYLALLLLALASAAALFEGRWRANLSHDRIARLAAEDDAQLAALETQLHATATDLPRWADPHAPGVVGGRLAARHAWLTPGPLAHVSIGQRDVAPTALRISLSVDALSERLEDLEDPRSMAQGSFDLAFVLVFLLPLVVLALGYDLVSGERELGTLPLLLAEAPRFGRVVLAKLLARAALLAVPLLALLAAVAVVSVIDGRPFDGLGLFGLFSLSVCYASFWFALILLVQRLRRSSATNALVGVCSWIGLLMLVPTAFNVLLQAVDPVPSRVELIEATRLAQREAAEHADHDLDRYNEDHPSSASQADQDRYWPLFALKIRHVLEETEPVEARHELQVERQIAASQWLQFLSPPAVMRSGVDALAGSGLDRHRRFVTQIRAFHGRYRDYFEPRILARERFEAADLPRVPRFELVEQTNGQRATQLLGAMLALLVPTALLGWLALRGARGVPWLEEAGGQR